MLIDPTVSYTRPALIALLEEGFDAGSIHVVFNATRVTVHRPVVVDGTTVSLALLTEIEVETTSFEDTEYVRVLRALGRMRESCAAAMCGHGQQQPYQATEACLV